MRTKPQCILSYDLGRIYSRDDLICARAEWKRAGRTVVFTNGCYDIRHPGHVRLLESARSLGDVLILALNTDAGVQRLKGPSRPIVPQALRGEMAAALQAVGMSNVASALSRDVESDVGSVDGLMSLWQL